MPRPWQRIVVENDHGVGMIAPDGRLFAGVNVAMSDDDVAAMRQGYKCIQCWENLDNAFPEACPVCGFACKRHQSERFALEYAGHDPNLRTGPKWDRIADQLQERAERRAFAKRAKESGISLAGKSVGEAIKRMKGAS